MRLDEKAREHRRLGGGAAGGKERGATVGIEGEGTRLGIGGLNGPSLVNLSSIYSSGNL